MSSEDDAEGDLAVESGDREDSETDPSCCRSARPARIVRQNIGYHNALVKGRFGVSQIRSRATWTCPRQCHKATRGIRSSDAPFRHGFL